MAKLLINGLDHYFEISGEGQSLVFIHGSFADARIWNPQWDHFSKKYQVVRYDLRGHGRTGISNLEQYRMDTFADDLDILLNKLEIRSPIICGLSWGGSIAQAYAVQHPEKLRGLILAGSMIAIDLTLMDRILCNVLFPGWAMKLAIRSLSVRNFVRFSFWLASITMGKQWLSRDESARSYLEQCMLNMDGNEYLKIWEAIYDFHLHPLERITCPVIVLNGEFEPENTFRHTREIVKKVPQATTRIIPGARHGMNLEEPALFNEMVEEFIGKSSR